MTREEQAREPAAFSDWHAVGFAYALEGTALTASALRLSDALGRALTANESLLFAEGWAAGRLERAALLAERETDAILAAVESRG